MSPQKTDLRALARNMLRPGYAAEMVHKVVLRVRAARKGDHEEARSWAESRTESLEDFARGLDAALWSEAEGFARELEVDAARRLAQVPVQLGGGGDYRLLYFLVRHRRPKTVVETGVAAGFSSRAILAALKANGSGALHSSDFPYFRVADPEQYIGVIVPDDLKAGWDLRTKGDRVNLRAFASEISTIDLLHYDSDKSYEGRQFALETLGPKLASDAVIVFDDIQDNLHFRDWVVRRGGAYKVFHFAGKWVGMVGA